jgi:hypothetical protein
VTGGPLYLQFQTRAGYFVGWSNMAGGGRSTSGRVLRHCAGLCPQELWGLMACAGDEDHDSLVAGDQS